ncbi:MAG: hypothetical protein ACLQIB_51560 [Isosphaeraceae bacterium]
MKSFLQRFGSFVSGVLHGFDRLRLRGSKRLLCTSGGVSTDRWASQRHPWLPKLLAQPVPYYWSVQEGEYTNEQK